MKLKATAAALVAGALAGCSSNPPPVAEMSAARTMVSQAQSEATLYAPDLLHAAQAKLASAQTALDNGDNEQARLLAEKAQADARLAWASAEHQRTLQAVADLDKSLETLKQEANRRSQ
jgi:chromosome segregation ATPase